VFEIWSIKMKKQTYSPLKLDQTDPRVIAAQKAEQELFAHYGLPYKEHFIEYTPYDIKLRVLEIGEGEREPLLIVPGNTGDGFPFVPLLPELQNRRVLLMNRPGGGLSEGVNYHQVDYRQFAVGSIKAVVDYFALDKTDIIAHSMGGHWSLWFSMQYPERVKRLVLPGVPGNVLDTNPPRPLRLAAIPGLNRIVARAISPQSPAQSLRSLSFMGHSDETVSALPPEMNHCYYHFQKLLHYRTTSLSMMEQKGIRISGTELRTVTAPVLLIWGGNDPFGSLASGKAIASCLPNAKLIEAPNGGHLPWLDDPAKVGAIISDFLL
jgi:pimeloyl-ACP methyl ester carboxylesterase